MGISEKESILTRKDDHINLCLEEDVGYDDITNELDEVKIHPSLIVEISPEEVNLSTTLLGKDVDYPIIISGMTGGTSKGKSFNEAFAEICNEFNIGMGVGSQRAAIENPKLAETYSVRQKAKNIPLIANLGVAQFLKGYGASEAGDAIKMIQADSLAIHINPLQEFVQTEGDRDLSESISRLSEIISEIRTPVILKGVGTGISTRDAQLIAGLDVYAVDVAGAGGTNWTKIEYYRNKKLKYLSKKFLNWGISTKESLVNINTVSGRTKFKIIASGGVWSGYDAVKAFLLGAEYVAFALPALKAVAKGGVDELRLLLKSYIFEMKTVMAMMNLKNLDELKKERHKIIDLE